MSRSNSEIRELLADARRIGGPSTNTFDMLCEVVEDLLERIEKTEQQDLSTYRVPIPGEVERGHGVRETPAPGFMQPNGSRI